MGSAGKAADAVTQVGPTVSLKPIWAEQISQLEENNYLYEYLIIFFY
jgi:hypothetical protein